MAHCRIATVTKTGERFIVQQINLAAGIVHCWGEVTRAEGLKSHHAASVRYMRSHVTIQEVEKTAELLQDLFMQRIRRLQREGHVFEIRGRKHKKFIDLGKEAAL